MIDKEANLQLESCNIIDEKDFAFSNLTAR